MIKTRKTFEVNKYGGLCSNMLEQLPALAVEC